MSLALFLNVATNIAHTISLATYIKYLLHNSNAQLPIFHFLLLQFKEMAFT